MRCAAHSHAECGGVQLQHKSQARSSACHKHKHAQLELKLSDYSKDEVKRLEAYCKS